jgi:hypothetical protein
MSSSVVAKAFPVVRDREKNVKTIARYWRIRNHSQKFEPNLIIKIIFQKCIFLIYNKRKLIMFN